MKDTRQKFKDWSVWLTPLYRASMATLAALFFGLVPILFAWLTLLFNDRFQDQYASPLVHGEALILAASLVGPALVLAFKPRDPDTIFAPQLLGLVGLFLLLTSVAVFELASSNPSGTINLFQQRLVLKATWLLLPVCTLYALWISYMDERGLTLKELQRMTDTNGSSLTLQMPSGDIG